VANEMGAPFNQLEMASFMTCSKGYMGECGIRGGIQYMQYLCYVRYGFSVLKIFGFGIRG
jgi:hypothetical protein